MNAKDQYLQLANIFSSSNNSSVDELDVQRQWFFFLLYSEKAITLG